VLAHYHRTQADPYGATNPSEFFAVVTEEIFKAPRKLQDVYLAVYEQLKLFYRQDPATRV
jgi:Mlc titration factor MtfA (ptsG expression regulator)